MHDSEGVNLGKRHSKWHIRWYEETGPTHQRKVPGWFEENGHFLKGKQINSHS